MPLAYLVSQTSPTRRTYDHKARRVEVESVGQQQRRSRPILPGCGCRGHGQKRTTGHHESGTANSVRLGTNVRQHPRARAPKKNIREGQAHQTHVRQTGQRFEVPAGSPEEGDHVLVEVVHCRVARDPGGLVDHHQPRGLVRDLRGSECTRRQRANMGSRRCPEATRCA